MEQIRILIADDHASYTQGLRAMLRLHSNMNVVGEAKNGDEAIALATRLQPDIILMDIKIPDSNGIEATKQILFTSPHIGILIFTMFEDDDTVFAALRAGARGYLLKGASKAEILSAIQSIHRGEAIFGAQIAKRVMHHFANLSIESIAANSFPELSNRELDVLNLVAQHKSNQEIASELGIASKTVRNHVSNILNKLQVIDRAQAIIQAKQAGLGKDSI